MLFYCCRFDSFDFQHFFFLLISTQLTNTRASAYIYVDDNGAVDLITANRIEITFSLSIVIFKTKRMSTIYTYDGVRAGQLCVDMKKKKITFARAYSVFSELV